MKNIVETLLISPYKILAGSKFNEGVRFGGVDCWDHRIVDVWSSLKSLVGHFYI